MQKLDALRDDLLVAGALLALLHMGFGSPSGWRALRSVIELGKAT
jgi:hypothetical protein